jgi:hypothetical protein
MVDIPYGTPEDQIEQEAGRVAYANLGATAQADVVQVGLYHVPEPDDDEDLLDDEDAFADAGG